MFCKNCGTQIPDNSAHCPNCGAAQNAAPQQAAPMNPTGAPVQAAPMNAAPGPAPAPAPKAPSSFNPNFNKTVNVGGKNLEFSLANIIPIAMVVIILFAMIGIHSLTVGSFKVRTKSAEKYEKTKYTYDVCIDELTDDHAVLDDDGFASFMKFLEVFTEIIAIAGVAGCLIFMNRDNIWAARCLALSGAAMVLGYLFMIIFMFHLKGEIKDLKSTDKIKGGPAFMVWVVFFLCIIVTAAGVLAPMVLDKNKKTGAPVAPAAPAGGFGGFNG